MSRDVPHADGDVVVAGGGAGVQRMAPAPPLPSVLDGSMAPSAPSVSSGVAALSPAPASSPPPVSPAASLAAFSAQVARVHQEYVSRSTDLHRAFLAMWRRTSESLTQPIDRHRQEPVASAPPLLDTADLIVFGSGRISSVFGEAFARQDGHTHQLRLPKPPLLFTDRVTRIDGVQGSMSNGVLWSETDVADTAWYLDDAGRMPPGVVAEAGNTHIVLLSWLGADWLHAGDRRHRIISGEVTLHGELPQAGDTCVYEVRLEAHAKVGDAFLFVLHYTCTVRGERRASFRIQTGLFTAAELTAPGGSVWNPAADDRLLETPFDVPDRCTEKRAFSSDDVRAFANGRPAACFGRGFERANAHVRTPKIPAGRMRQLDEIEEFDPAGGPWRRGYLRAAAAIPSDAWYFDAHFHNDPCMPGFLMLEAGLQSMAFYLAALGFTIERDGWRFEPAPGSYTLAFKGQVTPDHRRLTSEVFVESVIAGPEPTLVADVLVAIDGRPVFHMRRARLRLVMDNPIEQWARLGPPAQLETGAPAPLSPLGGLVGHVDMRPVATVDGMPLGLASILECAWGRPSRAMGPSVARFDRGRLMRLPGPPFLFVSRVTRVEVSPGSLDPGGWIETEYDVPARVWYFEQQGAPVMPFSVLLEAILQPCGWMSVFAAAPMKFLDTAFLFRNLDGTGRVLAEVGPGAIVRTRVRLVSAAPLANTGLITFEVDATTDDGVPVASARTTFGFFPPEAFHDQAGLPASPEEQARVSAPGSFFVGLTARPARYCGGAPRLAGPMLLMLDRITACDLSGGAAGLGYVRAEKDIDPAEWFFKAHFFRDPVQPGSLGLEALCQLLQCYLIERDLGADRSNARFESLQLDRPLTWKYRGQVVPESRRIVTEIVVTDVGRNARGPYAVADGWLWIDGLRVYSVTNLAVGIVGG